MSWSGLGIMDGDAPMDARAELLQLVGCNDSDLTGKFCKEFVANRDTLWAYCLEHLRQEDPYPAQVWGLMAMSCGAKITADDLEVMKQGAYCDLTMGMEDPLVRAFVMQLYLEALNDYKGQAIDVDKLAHCQPNGGRLRLRDHMISIVNERLGRHSQLNG